MKALLSIWPSFFLCISEMECDYEEGLLNRAVYTPHYHSYQRHSLVLLLFLGKCIIFFKSETQTPYAQESRQTKTHKLLSQQPGNGECPPREQSVQTDGAGRAWCSCGGLWAGHGTDAWSWRGWKAWSSRAGGATTESNPSARPPTRGRWRRASRDDEPRCWRTPWGSGPSS